MSKVKYALLCYDTDNIGDEIQSLAALRFLPRVDYYINRDKINCITFKKNEEVKIIMNGWYFHPPVSKKTNQWPPNNPQLVPLLTSMHFSFYNNVQDHINTDKSRAFLKKYSPVGARDKATLNFLESMNIPSTFSGCLTLTLLPDSHVKRSNFILAIDVDNELLQSIKERTKLPIINLSVYHMHNLDINEGFSLAKYWLYLYQKAHCIVTSRLHAILPALAFNTPVIAIDGPEPERFSGLLELANHYSKSEFIKNKTINLNHPLKNPLSYQKIRDDLVNQCAEFTGYDSKQSYMHGQTIEELYESIDFIAAIAKLFKESNLLETETIHLANRLNSANATIEQLKQSASSTPPLGVKASSKSLIDSIKRACKNRFS